MSELGLIISVYQSGGCLSGHVWWHSDEAGLLIETVKRTTDLIIGHCTDQHPSLSDLILTFKPEKGNWKLNSKFNQSDWVLSKGLFGGAALS